MNNIELYGYIETNRLDAVLDQYFNDEAITNKNGFLASYEDGIRSYRKILRENEGERLFTLNVVGPDIVNLTLGGKIKRKGISSAGLNSRVFFGICTSDFMEVRCLSCRAKLCCDKNMQSIQSVLDYTESLYNLNKKVIDEYKTRLASYASATLAQFALNAGCPHENGFGLTDTELLNGMALMIKRTGSRQGKLMGLAKPKPTVELQQKLPISSDQESIKYNPKGFKKNKKKATKH